MKTQKKKSSLPFLLIVLALLLIFLLVLVIYAFINWNNEEDDNEETETMEVSAVIPKETKAEISEITTEEVAEVESETTTEEVTEVETVELNFTQLYLDFFEPYETSCGILTLENFQQEKNEKFAYYDVNITEGNENDLWAFNISDGTNKVYIAFYPINDMYENPPEDWNWTLSTLSYNSDGNEISISDRFHLNSIPTYTIYDKNSDTPNHEVTSIDELKNFMFSAEK